MTARTGKPLGRPPALTPEQDREVYEKVQLRKRLARKVLAAELGVTQDAIDFAVARERRRRRA